MVWYKMHFDKLHALIPTQYNQYLGVNIVLEHPFGMCQTIGLICHKNHLSSPDSGFNTSIIGVQLGLTTRITSGFSFCMLRVFNRLKS